MPKPEPTPCWVDVRKMGCATLQKDGCGNYRIRVQHKGRRLTPVTDDRQLAVSLLMQLAKREEADWFLRNLQKGPA